MTATDPGSVSGGTGPVGPDDPVGTAVGLDRMLEAAAARGLTVEVRQRPAAASLEEAAALLGISPADIGKTLVARLPGDRYVFAVIGGDTQIGWPKLRAVVGSSKMSLPTAEVALAATGYERGTITPIGSLGDWPLYVDRRLLGRTVAMGAGAPGFSAFVSVDDLVRAYEATVADIAN